MAGRQNSPANTIEDGDPHGLQEMVEAESIGEVVHEEPLTLDPSMLAPRQPSSRTIIFPDHDLTDNLQPKTLLSNPTFVRYLLSLAGPLARLSPTVV